MSKEKSGLWPGQICLTRSSVARGSSLICLTKYELSKISDLKDLNFFHSWLGPTSAETKSDLVEPEHTQPNPTPRITSSPTPPPRATKRPIKEKWIVNPKFKKKISSLLHSDESQEAIGEVLFLLRVSSGDHKNEEQVTSTLFPTLPRLMETEGGEASTEPV